MAAATISVDEFQALEQKVLQTVELIKKEREARAAAETERNAAQAHVAEVETQIAAAQAESAAARAETSAAQAEIAELRQRLETAGDVQSEIEGLQREREAVRQRVEKMLSTLDELQ